MRPDPLPSRLDNLCATLVAPPFILALVVLVANDFWFKRAWPGLMTGKLSDFAGIAIVAWLLLALTPGRRWIAYVSVALAFSWWKSLKYTLVAPDTMRFSVFAGPSGFPFGKTAWERTDPLIGDLKRQLPRTHRGLVLTQELDPERARP